MEPTILCGKHLCTHAVIDDSQFIDVSIAHGSFDNVKLGDATFHNVSLARARFDDVNLQSATFHNVNMTGARLENVNLGGANFKTVILIGARLENVNLTRVDICNSNLEDMKIDGVLVTDLLAAYTARESSAAP